MSEEPPFLISNYVNNPWSWSTVRLSRSCISSIEKTSELNFGVSDLKIFSTTIASFISSWIFVMELKISSTLRKCCNAFIIMHFHCLILYYECLEFRTFYLGVTLITLDNLIQNFLCCIQLHYLHKLRLVHTSQDGIYIVCIDFILFLSSSIYGNGGWKLISAWFPIYQLLVPTSILSS